MPSGLDSIHIEDENPQNVSQWRRKAARWEPATWATYNNMAISEPRLQQSASLSDMHVYQ